MISQAPPVLLGGQSVHDKIAIVLAAHPERSVESATRAEVIDACTLAMLHEFIRDLPEGYKTTLGQLATRLMVLGFSLVEDRSSAWR